MSVRRALTDDESTRVSDNLMLVPHIVNKLRGAKGPGVDGEFFEQYEDELIQEGNMALCRAAQKYNPGLGYAFSTYAGTAIHNALWRWISQIFNGPVAVPYYRSAKGDRPIHSYTGVDVLAEASGYDEQDFEDDVDYSLAAHRATKINRPYSDILDMVYYEDETFVGIAALIGTTAVKVKRLHDEALRFLKAEMVG